MQFYFVAMFVHLIIPSVFIIFILYVLAFGLVPNKNIITILPSANPTLDSVL